MTTPKKQRRRSMRQERELAESTGGRQHKGSGAVPGLKGDVRKRGVFRAECKYTKAKSYSVKRSELDKISSECSFGEIPVLDIAFVGSSGMTEDRWVAMPFASWEALMAKPTQPTTGFIRSLGQRPAPTADAADMEILKWGGPPGLCEHPNENPAVCPCPNLCYCRTHTCKNKHAASDPR